MVAVCDGHPCNLKLLENSIAKDIASRLRKAEKKYGCFYSNVSCSCVVEGCNCLLEKSGRDQVNQQLCSAELLKNSIQKKVKKRMEKARKKFACPVTSSLVCKNAKNGQTSWVSCNFLGATTHDDNQARGDAASCDLNILLAELSTELAGHVRKAKRYGCPEVAKLKCKATTTALLSNVVDCSTTTLQDVDRASSCNMELLTQGISEEFGEELLDAQRKYGCPVPGIICERDFTGYTCTALSGGPPRESKFKSPSPSPSPSSSEGLRDEQTGRNGRFNWHHRYMRGRRDAL